MDVGNDDRASAVSIRRATAKDYDDIAALWSDAGLTASTKGRDGKEAFCRQVRHFGLFYLVATEKDRIIGVVLGSHDQRKGWINRLAVHPDYRRRGVAERLVIECDAAIRAVGIEIVAALITPDNRASHTLFEKLGYRTDVPVRYYRKLSRPEA